MSNANEPRKRVRLSLACNQCRARKVRCDEQLPSCKRCLLAGIPCVTTNPRKPEEESAIQHRKRAGFAVGLGGPEALSRSVSESSSNLHQGIAATADAQQDDSRDHHLNDATGSQSGLLRSAGTPLANHQNATKNPLASTDNVPASDIESPAFAMNTAGTNEQKWLGPSSLQVFTHWLETTFHKPEQGLADRFQYGMRFAEEMELPATVYMPALPPDWQVILDAFSSSVLPLFPIVDQASLAIQAKRMVTTDVAGLPIRERPAIAVVYACLAIGAQNLYQIELGRRLLSAASSLYAYLVAFPYLQSAQALLLLVLGLRARNKDGAGSQALGQAIRILHSIGVHKTRTHRASDTALEIGRRVWWCAYCLERVMSIESGRPSHIHDEDIDRSELDTPMSTREPDDESFFLILAAQLARLQGQVSSRLFSRRVTPPNPGEILSIAGELDQALVQWQSRLPEDLRPDTDILTGEPHVMAIQCYLAMQYHSVLATVHRAALLMDRKIHLANVEGSQIAPQYASRLRSSETICATSARKMAAIFLEAKDANVFSPLNTMTQPLLAIYILAIHTLRNPTAWKARIDLNTLQAAAEAAEQRYRDEGQDHRFYGMLSVLKQFASQERLAPLTRSASATTQTSRTEASITSPWPQTASMTQNQEDLSNVFEGWQVLFPHLYLGDNTIVDAGQHALSDADMYDLMGIPQLSDEELMGFHLPDAI